jgi:hypothetical protein
MCSFLERNPGTYRTRHLFAPFDEVVKRKDSSDHDIGYYTEVFDMYN